jgi:hypothetical protein
VFIYIVLGSNPHDLLEDDFVPWGEESPEQFVNEMLHGVFADKSLCERLQTMPRDALNSVMDELGEGRKLLVEKLKTHMDEKVAQDPMYILSNEVMMSIMGAVFEELRERPPPTPQI